MQQMKFLSIRELQQHGSGIKDILDNDGKIVITSNGKPIGITVGVNENSFEEILDDWKTVRQIRRLRYIDKKLDESERMATDPNAVWIDEEDFWAQTDGYEI